MGFYKHEYSFAYFLNRLSELFQTRNDVKFDLVCLCPSSSKGSLNENMNKLITEFCKKTGVENKQILTRIRDTKKQHEILTKDERILNVKDSLDLTENIEGKNILVIDNLSNSGSTAQEVHRLIVHKNKAKTCIFLCLSLGYKGRNIDFDINPNFKGKFSDIIAKWHWPKVPIEKRIKKEVLPNSQK
ncbi:MAG: hypothetical protein AB1391_04815 [Candidatus Micrarchaeota archaeon]